MKKSFKLNGVNSSEVNLMNEFLDISNKDERMYLGIIPYLKAAEQKYKYSQYHLCVIYEKLYKLEEAEKWCLKAAEQKHLEASYNLSKIYAYQKKWGKAKKFREKAKKQQIEKDIARSGSLWGSAYLLNQIK